MQIWRHIHGVDKSDLSSECGWHFITSTATAESRHHFPLASIASLPDTIDGIVNAIEKTKARLVFLQYVNYCYDRNGIPSKLLEALRRWRSAGESRRLATMFHELYAFGPPWKKAFWLRNLQRQSMIDFAGLSDVVATSNVDYYNNLAKACPASSVHLIPIGANFQTSCNKEKQWRSLSIFGLRRLDSLEFHRGLLRFLAAQGLVDKVVLCGKRIAGQEQQEELGYLRALIGNTVTIEEYYDMPPDAIPNAVTTCGLSITNVRSSLLGKSGRFQFACSLGQVTLSRKVGAAPATGVLLPGRAFVEYTQGQLKELPDTLHNHATLKAIGTEAYNLSQTEFSWHSIAEKWQQLFGTI